MRAFCDALGIANPIVLGASFGGMVALAYATRHPAHPSKLILISTEAAGGSHRERRVALFERFGGPEVGALARRRFIEMQGHDEASLAAWRRLALPHYFRIPRHPDVARRAVSRPEVLQWFTRPGGESLTFDLFPDLHRIRCPTLVMGGEDDPIHPIESQADIAAALPAASGTVRAVCGLPARRGPRCARTRHGGDPGFYRRDDLILRRLRSSRLEGWPQVRSWFETRASARSSP